MISQPMPGQPASTSFSSLLKHWRKLRRFSQLDLALEAGVSARHLSFLETGRAAPSRDMVLRLASDLEVPLADRNGLLQAAGFAAEYHQRDWSSEQMKPLRKAVDILLESHHPFPAFAIDRYWRVIQTNGTAAIMLGAMGVGLGDSLLAPFEDTDRLKQFISNWREVGAHLAVRLKTEARELGNDAFLSAAAERLAEQCGQGDLQSVQQAVIPARYLLGDMGVSMFSTITQFGTPGDIAVADLRIEHLFPADDDSEAILRSVASQSAS
ncbi:MAG: helix-turn-helix domain-containing protein [Pseudomonadota bacterium]